MRLFTFASTLLVLCLLAFAAQAEIKKGKNIPSLEDAHDPAHVLEDHDDIVDIEEDETPCSFILFEKSSLPANESIALCRAALKSYKAQLQFEQLLETEHAPHPTPKGKSEACSVVGEVGKSCPQ